MPIYTGDYQRDTRHLSMAEHGAYFNLLMHCWDQAGPLPIDDRRIMAIAGARTAEEIDAVQSVLREFFVRDETGWYSRRMQLEIERSRAISKARSIAGSKGYDSKLAKAKQLPIKRKANA